MAFLAVCSVAQGAKWYTREYMRASWTFQSRTMQRMRHNVLSRLSAPQQTVHETPLTSGH